MKYTLLISIYLATVKTDDTSYLQDIYFELSQIYELYLFKEHNFLDPIYWKTWMEPMNFQPPKPIETYYDFIIVGSGPAGTVLANRLSEIHDWSVLLLEAGKGENLWAQVPVTAPTMTFTHYNWNHMSEYQPHLSSGLEQHRMKWPRGKALGGGSVINYMIYTRGNRYDFDRWESGGNPGWSYRDVLPYYIKSEDAKLELGDPKYHGKGGYLSIESPYLSELVFTFIEAGEEVGLPHIDYNANVHSFGVSTMQANLLKGRRHTVASAFLRPVRHRPNLHIVTSAFVTKILIDPVSRQAYGVEYEKNTKKYTVGAKREVILSAGTFNSAQLLMLAGVGPRNHLQELGIPVLENLPVGQNLHDHLAFPGLCFLINETLSLSAVHFLNPKNILRYLVNGTGPYASLGGAEGIGYIKTPLSQFANVPDIELIFVDGSLNTDYGLFSRRWMNIRDDIYNALFAPTHNIPTWSIFPMLLHPRSTGFLKLQSKDPRVHPLLYGNYFTDPDNSDLDTMLYAIRFIQKLAATKAFQKYQSKLNQNRIPGCELYEFDSDDYWKCAIRAISVTQHHQVGTVKMGPPDDPTSVVNHELKVYGIGGLRVADCSIIPFAVGAHTHAVSIMIGEKAADIIKDNWGRLDKKSEDHESNYE